MPRNGSGTYTLPQSAFVTNTVISSSAMNSDLSDIASALTASIANDGQTTLSAAIKNPNGSAGTPGVSFNGDATTGLYLSSAGTIGFSAGGTSIGTSTSGTTTWSLNTIFSGTISDPRGKYTGVLLNTLTASTSATLSDTTSLTNNYSYYDIVCIALVPDTNDVTAQLQVHSGGAFKTTGYLGATLAVGSAASGISNATTCVQLSRPSLVLTSLGISGTIRVFNPSVSAVAQWRGQFVHADGTVYNSIDTAGAWNTSGVVDGFQILFSSGNISSGTVKIIGYL